MTSIHINTNDCKSHEAITNTQYILPKKHISSLFPSRLLIICHQKPNPTDSTPTKTITHPKTFSPPPNPHQKPATKPKNLQEQVQNPHVPQPSYAHWRSAHAPKYYLLPSKPPDQTETQICSARTPRSSISAASRGTAAAPTHPQSLIVTRP